MSLQYYYKSYWHECLDGSHSIFRDGVFEWHNEYKEFHRLNKPAMIHLTGSLHWMLNGKPYNPSIPTDICMSNDGEIDYIFDKNYQMSINHISYDVDHKTYFLFLDDGTGICELQNRTDKITHNISEDETLNIISRYLPVENPVLYLPPIII